VAVKTGTTDEARDAWTIGYAKQLAVGVWVGNNDNTPMNNGGSSMAGPIWRATILAGLKGQANQKFTPPSDVTRTLICRSNGLRAVGGGTEGTYQEYFIKDTVPTGTCEVPKEPEDSDKDGVTDDKDKCADTPAGTKVDGDGCPVKEKDPDEEKPEPAKKVDTDKDGVPDVDDKCPGTPTGTKVDATGCPVTTEETPGTGTDGGTTPTRPNGRGSN
jgi:membrane peptidoglycan carboxypeptidase